MSAATHPRVLAIGEVLWDIIRGEEHIGGAPFNLAAHLARLGCPASILTRVGDDPRGEAALDAMRQLGVETSLVQIDTAHPTGWAKVALTDEGVATYSFPEQPAYDFIDSTPAMIDRLKAARFDAVCFGTLQQKGERSRASLMAALQALRAPLVLYDVNIRLDFYPADVLRQSLAFSTVVKLNADEAPLVAERLYGVRLPEGELAKRLANEFPVRALCVTKGADGCTVYSGGQSRNIPVAPVQVVDTVGSGDAFSAAFLDYYFRSGEPFAAAERGNLLGAYVASRPGAVPEYNAALRRRLACQEPPQNKL